MGTVLFLAVEACCFAAIWWTGDAWSIVAAIAVAVFWITQR